MKHYALYEVSTNKGGSLDTIVVDVEYDTLEERQHRAWCKLLENERTSHYKMAKRLMNELGVKRAKEMFAAALVFNKVA